MLRKTSCLFTAICTAMLLFGITAAAASHNPLTRPLQPTNTPGIVAAAHHLCHKNDSTVVAAQRPFEGHFVCKELGVHLHLNLYEENLLVPGSEFLGNVHGYMHQGIYGIWMLIKHEIKGNKALLRFSNDIGSDSQNIEFEHVSDSLYHLRTVNGNALRKAVGRKLVKVANEMDFHRQ